MAHHRADADIVPVSVPDAGSGDPERGATSNPPISGYTWERSGCRRGAQPWTIEPGNSGADAPAPANQPPPAGPHADPKLTNNIVKNGPADTVPLLPTGQEKAK